jgi:DNA-binding MarR family transcriptional regulator
MIEAVPAAPELDRTVHERARLMILTRLASSDSGAEDFTALKAGLGLTQGNLSVHLKNLEEAGYVAIEKRFVNGKPRTTVALSESGRTALMKYLDEMESIIKSLKR